MSLTQLYQALSSLPSFSEGCTLEIFPYNLNFIKPARTSRGSMAERKIWILKIKKGDKIGFGECAPLAELSPDLTEDFEGRIYKMAELFNTNGMASISKFLKKTPTFNFALETALLDLATPGLMTPFSINGQLNIPINGLIWMGAIDQMQAQAIVLLEKEFKCVKLKIGALEWNLELELISWLRKKGGKNLEIRVDANGAFREDAESKLRQLKEMSIHSIEQPIAAGNFEQMANLAGRDLIPIALDEELLSLRTEEEKEKLIRSIKPQYLVLKPGLLGGYKQTLKWIELAEKLNIGWWITSALESNIGLNAISRFSFLLNNPMAQGLGTGSLYLNNIESPLIIKEAHLQYGDGKWTLPEEWND